MWRERLRWVNWGAIERSRPAARQSPNPSVNCAAVGAAIPAWFGRASRPSQQDKPMKSASGVVAWASAWIEKESIEGNRGCARRSANSRRPRFGNVAILVPTAARNADGAHDFAVLDDRHAAVNRDGAGQAQPGTTWSGDETAQMSWLFQGPTRRCPSGCLAYARSTPGIHRCPRWRWPS